MRIILVLAVLVSGALSAEDFNGIDYLPATQAFTRIKSI